MYPTQVQDQLPANAKIIYPEPIDIKKDKHVGLDPVLVPRLEVDVPDMYLLTPDEFATTRHKGFGGSDSSILLGVNPFTSLSELIVQKASDTASPEEIAVGSKIAVRKGNDLEGLMMDKYQKWFKTETIKPTDQFKFKEYPYLKMNFDGIAVLPDRYLPVECKLVTATGEKHYNPTRAIFTESKGFLPLQRNVADENRSIESKAANYGIPAYYYTQLQMEMFAVGADIGYLNVLYDKSWELHVYMVFKDMHVVNGVIVNGYKAWERVNALRVSKGLQPYE